MVEPAWPVVVVVIETVVVGRPIAVDSEHPGRVDRCSVGLVVARQQHLAEASFVVGFGCCYLINYY